MPLRTQLSIWKYWLLSPYCVESEESKSLNAVFQSQIFLQKTEKVAMESHEEYIYLGREQTSEFQLHRQFLWEKLEKIWGPI